MQENTKLMALSLPGNMRVTVAGHDIWCAPGDVILDAPDGTRKMYSKIQFEEFIEQNGYVVSADRGAGWVACVKAT